MQIPTLDLHLLRLCVESQASALQASKEIFHRESSRITALHTHSSSCPLSQLLAEEEHLKQKTLNLTSNKKDHSCVKNRWVWGILLQRVPITNHHAVPFKYLTIA